MKGLMIKCARWLLAAAMLPAAAAASLLLRRRAHAGERPRVLFGITPIINNKYWSQSLRKLGYVSASFVYGLYHINRGEDFDHTPETIFPSASRVKYFFLVQPYLCFLWALRNFDVFVLDFDGGFLRGTPLQFLEFPLLALAGRKVVAIPYGSDAMDVRRCADDWFRDAILRDYPALSARADEIARRVRHYCRWASFIICGGAMVDFLYRADLLTASICGIDAGEWRDEGPGPGHVGSSPGGPVRILHAPNHSNIKGTQFLVAACEELRSEGVPVELIVRQGVPNQQIRELMREADIVASAFLTGYYELFAIEGMSMGKPVLNYWRPDLKAIYSTYSFASECPVVDTPVEKIKENVRALVADPELRARLGEAGRRYVEKYHSHEAIGRLLDRIVREVWHGGGRAGGPGAVTLEQIRAQYPFDGRALLTREPV